MKLLDSFLATHHHPVNRGCHLLAALCLGAALPLFFFRRRNSLALGLLGALLLGIGHAVEGEPPAFLQNRGRRGRRHSLKS